MSIIQQYIDSLDFAFENSSKPVFLQNLKFELKKMQAFSFESIANNADSNADLSPCEKIP